MALSAYGVNVTPPSPISYAVQNPSSISSIIGGVQAGQNAANAANSARYAQALAAMTAGANGANQYQNLAQSTLNGQYGNALNQLKGGLANDNAIFANDNLRVGQQAKQAASAAQQNAISRGLGNTTITNALQDQVTRAANDAYTNAAATKAANDNSVNNTIANMFASYGNNAANQYDQSGQVYANGAGNIANVIASRNDVAPSLSDYAQLIQGAQAAQSGSGRENITTTIPDNSAIAQRINNPGMSTIGGINAATGSGGSLSAQGAVSGGSSGGGGGGAFAGLGGGGSGGSNAGTGGYFGGGGNTSATNGGSAFGGYINDLLNSGSTAGTLSQPSAPVTEGNIGSTPGSSPMPNVSSNIPPGSTPIYGSSVADGSIFKIQGWKTPDGRMIAA